MSVASRPYGDPMGDVRAWLRGAPPARIDGRTVTLRRWTDDDLEPSLAAILESIDALAQWMPWASGYDRAAGWDFLARSQAEWDARATFGYAIRTTVDNQVIGSIGLHPRIAVGGLEIGYWVRTGATGRGHATRAAALLTDAALRVDGVTYAEIRHDRANRISGRIPRRLGYRHVDTVTSTRDAPGESGTALHWRMAAVDYPTSVAAHVVADETGRAG